MIYENGAPEIMPILVRHVPCTDGGRQLTPEAWTITRAHEQPFASLVAASSRRLPVLILIVDPTFPETHADEVANALAGLAHVA